MALDLTALKITTIQPKVFSLTIHRALSITAIGQNLESAEQSVYLGSVASTHGDIELGVARRINIAKSAFA